MFGCFRKRGEEILQDAQQLSLGLNAFEEKVRKIQILDSLLPTITRNRAYTITVSSKRNWRTKVSKKRRRYGTSDR